MKFAAADIAAILDAVGEQVIVRLHGAEVATITGFTQYEEVIAGDEAEIGRKILTLKVDAAWYDTLAKSSSYTFEPLDGIQYKPRGPALQDGGGFKKLQLTKAA